MLSVATVVLLHNPIHSAFADTFGSGDNTFEIDFVTVGNPGNPPDTTGNPNPAGSVPYVYRIGMYEISRDIVETASAAGNLGITLDPMDFISGILGDGPRPDMPATGVSWNEAVRFVNWLNTSEGFSPAYKFSTDPGDGGYDANENILPWQKGDPGFNGANRFRNKLARYVLSSADEWYKAAYYDPNASDGAGWYWDYPTGSDVKPTAVASGSDPETAVYSQLIKQGPSNINEAGGLSRYGVMGLGGNVWEWHETEIDLVNDNVSSLRVLRGGFWGNDSGYLSASHRSHAGPSFEGIDSGFRVTSIPELAGPLGDLDLDGEVDFDDTPAFVLGLHSLSEYVATFEVPPTLNGDLDEDGDFDFDDIPGFVDLLGPGVLYAVPEPSTGLLAVLAAIGPLVCRRR
jgi:hypothetical protein